MKTTSGIRIALASLVGCLTWGALAADPAISDVVVRQRWPWSRQVDIEYVLSCETTQRVDVALTAFDSATLLTLPAQSLSGDLKAVAQGARRIVWDPSQTPYTNATLANFRVALAPVLSPSYLIVDLTKSLGAEGQITYRYDWSAWLDITNQTEFMTTKLVLRHLAPGTFTEGSTPETEGWLNRLSYEDQRRVTLTKDSYIGVFEVTQKQWALLMNNDWPSWFNNEACRDTRPVEKVSYVGIRGNSMTVGEVATGSFMEKLKTLTGLTFDLPSEAQWEYACRAGTTTPYNDGVASPTHDTVNKLARCLLNSSSSIAYHDRSVDTTMGTARVGSYQANAWGIYDMHGNVWELCLDNWIYNWGTVPAVDPLFFNSATLIPIRGNAYTEDWWSQRSARRSMLGNSENYYSEVGFRVWAALP